MGGRDKGLLTVSGRPAVELVIERLRPQVDRLIINANRNTEAYAKYGLPVVPDEEDGYPGPLAGMAAGLAAAGADHVLTVPCDSPWLPPDLAPRLLAALHDGDAELATVTTAEGLQPVFTLLSWQVRESLRRFLGEGGRKIDRWFVHHRVALADFSDCPQAFANINTPEELAAAEGKGTDGPATEAPGGSLG